MKTTATSPYVWSPAQKNRQLVNNGYVILMSLINTSSERIERRINGPRNSPGKNIFLGLSDNFLPAFMLITNSTIFTAGIYYFDKVPKCTLFAVPQEAIERQNIYISLTKKCFCFPNSLVFEAKTDLIVQYL